MTMLQTSIYLGVVKQANYLYPGMNPTLQSAVTYWGIRLKWNAPVKQINIEKQTKTFAFEEVLNVFIICPLSLCKRWSKGTVIWMSVTQLLNKIEIHE